MFLLSLESVFLFQQQILDLSGKIWVSYGPGSVFQSLLDRSAWLSHIPAIHKSQMLLSLIPPLVIITLRVY